MGLSIKEKIMKALLAGIISLIMITPAMAQHVVVHGQRHFHGHRHMHHFHGYRGPVVVYRDNWVAPLVGGVVLGAVIADAHAKSKEEQVEKVERVRVCTEWKEVMTDDGKIYRERICKE
jgi:hypothetical protein